MRSRTDNIDQIDTMDNPKITKLYKYLGNHKRVLEILKTGCIYYPKPDKFNDPFDCDIEIVSSVSWDQFEQVIRIKGKKLNKKPEEVEQKIRSVRNGVPAALGEYQTRVREGVKRVRAILKEQGVLTLSAISDSIPMWGYYADGHRGMCVELRRTPENTLGSTATKPVHYTDDYPEVSFFNLFEHPGFLSETVMRTKSSAWKHEQEWRVFLTNGNIFYDLPGEITGVLFGLRTPKEHKQEVAKLVRNREGITLWQATEAPRRFQIDFVEYEP